MPQASVLASAPLAFINPCLLLLLPLLPLLRLLLLLLLPSRVPRRRLLVRLHITHSLSLVLVAPGLFDSRLLARLSPRAGVVRGCDMG